MVPATGGRLVAGRKHLEKFALSNLVIYSELGNPCSGSRRLLPALSGCWLPTATRSTRRLWSSGISFRLGSATLELMFPTNVARKGKREEGLCSHRLLNMP